MYYTWLTGTLNAKYVSDSVDNTFTDYFYTEAKALAIHVDQLGAYMGVTYIKINELSQPLTGTHTFWYDGADGYAYATEDTNNLLFLYGRTGPVETKVYLMGDPSLSILYGSNYVIVSGDWTT